MENHSQIHRFGSWAVILAAVLFSLTFPPDRPAYAADGPGSPILAPEMCFDQPVAIRLLKAIEKDLPEVVAEADACAEHDEAVMEALESCQGNISALSGRLADVAGERDRALLVAQEAQQAGKEGIKTARGSWWERAKSALSWMGAGAALALIGMLLI